MSDAINGTITGTVKDNQGEPLPGVTITLQSRSTPAPPRVEVSDAQGRYRYVGVAPGNYDLTAQLEGFATFKAPNVVVRADQTVVVDVVLTPSRAA